MRKKLKRTFIILALLLLLLFIPFFILEQRAPVLIVADETFIELYGEKRLERELNRNTALLFRNVKIVPVSNEISDDLVPYSVSGISAAPYCVLFPLRFTSSAKLYHKENPDINVIILDGRNKNDVIDSSNLETANLFKYKTNIEADFFKIGNIAAFFQLPPAKNEEFDVNQGQKNQVIVFLESNLYNSFDSKVKEAFNQGINRNENPPEVIFYNNYSEFVSNPDISCVVMVGAGSEFLENNKKTPILLYSWIDPSMSISSAAVIIDDSPLGQVYQAVKLFESGSKTGEINSRFIISDNKKKDKALLRKLRESS